MKLSMRDRSLYYKGLLILTKRDHVIDDREREWLLELGKLLDFDRRFCEAAIADLLRNRHITHSPVIFSSQEAARCFFRDALRLALADRELHRHEEVWLKNVARANGLDEEWMKEEIEHFLASPPSSDPAPPPEILRCL